jgi:nicotinamidase-related amidase
MKTRSLFFCSSVTQVTDTSGNLCWNPPINDKATRLDKRKEIMMTKNVGLLITSAQNDLLSPNGKAWGLTKETVLKNEINGNLKTLAEAARAANIPIFFSPVSFDYAKLTDFEPLSSIQSVILENRLLESGTMGAEIIADLAISTEDVVLTPRQGFSSFWANTLQSHLKHMDVKTLIIAGMLAEGCVESHARDAVENGYRPIIVSDAIGSTSVELLEASLKTLALHSANLKTTQQMLASWREEN